MITAVHQTVSYKGRKYIVYILVASYCWGADTQLRVTFWDSAVLDWARHWS